MVTRGLSWRWLICLGLLCPAAGSAHGPHGGHGASSAPIPPNLASGLGASAAFDSRGWLWAVYKEEGYVILRHSENLGGSWSSPRPVNSVPEPIDADGDSRPKIAFGPEDELYVTWTKPLKKLYTGDIRFSRSTDGADIQRSGNGEYRSAGDHAPLRRGDREPMESLHRLVGQTRPSG